MSTSTDLMTTLAWSLLHFLWQGAAIAALAAAAMELFRQSATRYVIGVFALALMCVSFGVTFALLAAAPDVGTGPVAAASAWSPAVAPEALPPGSRELLLDRQGPWLDFVWVARGWLAGVGLLALRVACGLLVLELLRRRSLSVLPVEIVERCLALQRRLGISRVVRYCECRLVAVPSVIGFFRPIVLLPLRALTGLSAEQLDVVIAHELGHIKRFDVAVNLFQVVVETLFFFHPAVWWLNRRIHADRENCCDDIAISAGGHRASYARALAIMEEWRGTPALSMAATGGDVASRVARLLGMSRQPTGVRSAGVFTAALALAVALIAGAASIGIAGQGRIVVQAEPLPQFAQVEPPAQFAQVEPPAQFAQAEPLAQFAQVEPPAQFAQAEPLAQLAQVEPRPQAGPENPRRPVTERAPAGARPGASYIDEMRSVGVDVTDVDLLVALKVNGVTADFVRQIRDAGLDPDTDELIAMKVHGVTPEDFEQARALGPDVGLDEVLAMKVHGVTLEDIEQARAFGLDVGLDEVLAMKIHGVTLEDIEQARALGSDVGLDEVLAMKIHGITPEFIEEARSHGFEDLDVDQLIQLKNADVL